MKNPALKPEDNALGAPWKGFYEEERLYAESLQTEDDEEDIHRPKHYTSTSIQPKRVILEWGLNHCLGNVIKYICRHGQKKDGYSEDLERAAIKDLMKARQDITIDIRFRMKKYREAREVGS